MEQQYYTPALEDFRVGYEYEMFIPLSEDKKKVNSDYEKKVFVLNDSQKNFINNCFFNGLETGWLRVPYLSKEQIEKEGWALVHDEGVNYSIFVKDDWELTFWPFDGVSVRIDLSFVDFGADVTENFKGDCPSVNEMRQIVKFVTKNTNFPLV